MSTPDLLRRLDDLGVELTSQDGKLRYRSPAGKLPEALVTDLKLHKDELMALLEHRARLPRHPVHDGSRPPRSGPLTRTQRTVWATDYFRQDGTYNLTGALRLRGALDGAAFRAALADAQVRHPSLRTVFTQERGEPSQLVLPASEPTVVHRDLGDLGPAEALSACLKECAELADRRLPLDTAPPVRQYLYRLAEDDHVFFVVLHHVIADGVSLGVLLEDLAHCYNLRLAGDSAGPPPSGLDMIDYARWEADFFRYANTGAARRYWQERLGGAVLGALPLPPAPEPVPGGGVVTARVDPATTEAVRALGARSRASAFTVVSAAVSTALLRYTGRDDLVVGMPVARRERNGLAGLVGLLLDMVPVRLDLGGAPTFLDLVQRTRTAVLGAAGNLLPPAGPETPTGGPQGAATAAQAPFHVVLTDAGTDGPGPRFDGLEVTRLDVEQNGSKYDLNFLIRDCGETLVLDVEFDRRAVAERDVRAMVAMVRRILAQGVADPDRPAAGLAAAPLGEAAPGAIGATPELVPQDGESLLSRLSSAARERGGATAVSHDGATLSYRGLDELVGRVGRGLRRRGIGPGDIVAVALPRGIDLLAAMIGIMASGAACVVLDDSWPQTRVDQVLADAGARLVVAAEPGPEADRVTVARLAEDGAQGTPLPPVPSAATAYVIFTSGSTGRPKGVQVSHRNVLSLLDSTSGAFGFGPDDTWTLFHSCSFDFSVWEIFGCLLSGGRLVVVPKWTTREPEAFAQLLRRERVTVLNQTPSALSVMLPAIARHEAAGHLRYIVFGGEALDSRLVDQWHETFGAGTRLVNMYGITETTVHASWRWLRADEARSAESEIGEPLPGTALHVLHSGGAPALDGCVGEIHVGGPQVSNGYIDRPRETALRFVPDPYSSVPGARMYRSGDFGRRVASGIAYLGRRDGQVQINGFRVELPEIEAALAARPGVAKAAAAISTEGTSPRIVAAVVSDGTAELSVPELLRAARAALPVYMVPHNVYVTAELPLTVNGKLDRAAVAAAGARADVRDASAPEPRTDAERILLESVREVLDGDAVLTDDFFALGGDSMRAIRLVGLARDRGLALRVQDVYASPEFIALAALAQPVPPAGTHGALVRRAAFSGLPGGHDGAFAPDVVDAYPMTALQTGMIYHRELAPESGVYHIVLSYRVGGPMDPEAFRSAVEAVMDRHAILRTSFDLGHARGPVQRVHDPVPAPVRFEDLRALAPEEQAARISETVRTETADDFDLSRAPLFRLVVLTRSADDYQLVFSHHHAILDGWSVNVFFEDLHDRYKELLAGRAAELSALTTTFADYVALEQSAAEDPAHREFWRERTLRPAPLLAAERPGRPVMRQLHGRLPDGTLTALSAAAHLAGVPLKALLQAAHVRVLSWLTGQDDVVTGLTSLCRPETADGDRMLGLFLNELPLRIRLGDQTWTDLARQIHAEELEMTAHRRYPHALIQRDHGSRPILDTNFNFTDFHTTKALVRAGSLEVLDVQEIESTHYPLGVNYTVDVRTRELRLIIEYDAASLTRRTAELTAQAHRLILAALSDDPARPFRTTALPGVAERARGPVAESGPADAQAAAVLPAPDTAGSPDDSGDAGLPLTVAEAELAREVREVWAEVLGDGDFDDRARFLDVGGSSLTAMQVVSRLRARHGELSMSTFMASPTVAALARVLHASAVASAAQQETEAAQEAGPEPAAPRRYPLSATQHQMWLLTERLPGLPLFGMPGALRADGPLSTAILEDAFTGLARRHEALRTRIEVTDGVPEQVVEATARLTVDVVDLRSEADPKAACEKAMTAAAREPMPLDSAPLLRLTVYRTAEEEHVIFLNVHHIVCDGWSMGLLLDEAAQAYRELAGGRELPAGARPLGSGQLTLARTEWLDSPEADRQRRYWAERLAGPWPSLTDGPGSRLARKGRAGLADSLRLAGQRTRIPAATVAGLREAGRRHRLTDFTTVLTAYASALSAWSGRDDIRIGTMVANRLTPGSDRTIGLVANTVVLRLDTDAEPAERALRARDVCNEAYDHQELPFEEVLTALTDGSARREGDGSLFEVMLVMQEEARQAEPGEGIGLAPYVSSSASFGRPVAPTTSDFVLAVTPVGAELELELLYKPVAFAAEDAAALLDDVVVAAQDTVAALEARS